MSTQATRGAGELARELFQRLFTDRDFDAVQRFWAEETVDHFLALGASIRGPQALGDFFRELLAAVPDARMVIERVIEQERQAVVQWTLQGTVDGAPFRGIEAPHRPLKLRGVDVLRFDDADRLAENTIYFDGADFARQLGMLPPQGSRADRAMVGAFNAIVRARRLLPGRRRR